MRYTVTANIEFEVDVDDITIEDVMKEFEVSFDHPDEAIVKVSSNEFVVSECE